MSPSSNLAESVQPKELPEPGPAVSALPEDPPQFGQPFSPSSPVDAPAGMQRKASELRLPTAPARPVGAGQPANLGEAVIARHSLNSSLFLSPPGHAAQAEAYIGQVDRKAALSMSSQEAPAILPQARTEIQRTAAPAARYESRLPLPGRTAVNFQDAAALVETHTENIVAAPTAQSLPLAQLQRSPDSAKPTAAVEASIVNFVQRASPVEPDGEGKEPVDLDELARMVYPLIKRILAVEQERLARRR
jgi:hypothetical protein